MSDPHPLDDALKRLSEAHGPSELAAAFRALSGSVKRKRRQDAAKYGILAQTFGEAMRQWDHQKRDGASLDERQANFEKTLRAAWPQARDWKYLCQRCDDAGWMFRTCTPETPCGRPFTLPPTQSHHPDFTGQGRCSPGHSYVVPCVCSKGQAYARQMNPPQASPEDFTKSGKTSKPTRPGRF